MQETLPASKLMLQRQLGIEECIDTSVIALCFRSECHNEYVLHANGRAGLQGGSGGQVR